LELLDYDEQELIYKVIGCHNLHHLPAIEDETILFFSKLLRDADKLDVFHVLLAHYQQKPEQRNLALNMNYPDTPGYSSEIIHDLQHKQSTKWTLVKNLNDMKLLQLGWMYDINFQPTVDEIKKRGYINTFFSLLPKDDTMQQMYYQLNHDIDQ
jgi:hypothetical protein